MTTYTLNCLDSDCTDFKVIKEVVHKMVDPHPPCEVCGSEMFTHFSKENVKPVQFKGDNWFSSIYPKGY